MAVYKFKATPMARQELSTKKVMEKLLIALVIVYIFGLFNASRYGMAYVSHALAMLFVALIGTIGAEVVYAKVIKKEPFNFLSSSFPWITAIILVEIVPADTSLYALFMSSVLGIFFGKLVFGGFGQNIFNPAAVARAILVTSFVSVSAVELISAATPAASAKSVSWIMTQESFATYLADFGGIGNMLLGLYHGALGETSALLILVLGAYLIYKEIIDWVVPVTYLGICFVAAALVGMVQGLGLTYALAFILTGGMVYGAVFMLTDPVTSPVSRPGRVIFAAFAALCTCLIRYMGNLPEGVCFAILLANMVSSVIDRIFTGKQLKDLKRNTIIVATTIVVVIASIFAAGANVTAGEYVQRVIRPAKGSVKYTGEAQGFGGTIIADVYIADGAISAIELTGDAETPALGGVAIQKLPERIVKAQTLDVELLSGATVSSKGIIEAVSNALLAAGIDPSSLTGNGAAGGAVEKTDETRDVDVVIVGCGGAGMSAAITAKQEGKSVLILEKMPYVGGNTTKASGGMNAASTKVQQEFAKGLDDEKVKDALLDSTVENFIADTMKGGHDINNIDLVTTMAEKSSEAVEWLESIGAPLPLVAATGGTVHYYLHEPADGSAVGEFLVESYNKTLEDLGIEVLLETKATEIIMADGAAAGVKAESPEVNYTINAGAVIITTGGFGANFDMLASFDPSLANAVTTNTPAATGDGIVMAEAVGADTVDMEQIQLHPTVFQANGLLVSERLRSNGAILVNKEGKRFVNDLATRDTVSQAELKQTDALAYIVYDSKYAEEKLYKKYVQNGLTVTADTLEDLAAALGFDDEAAKNFVATVEAWNKVCAGEAEDEFGRNNGLVSLDTAPYTAIQIAPGIHHTMGGLKINTSAEVISTDGSAIPGLFAAGEVTGGVHGGNRIGGNAVADIVVYGRIAGQSACAYVDNH